jgi:hypothetical protein
MRLLILTAALSGVMLLQVGHSNKGVEERLEKLLEQIEKLIKPRWYFWLPIAYLNPCSYRRVPCVATPRCSSARILWSESCIQSVNRNPIKHTANPSITIAMKRRCTGEIPAILP